MKKKKRQAIWSLGLGNGGRWMVITGTIVSRHRSLSEARRTARFYKDIGAEVRHYHRALVKPEDGCLGGQILVLR